MDTEMDWAGEGGIFMQKERVWDSRDIYSAGPQDTAGVPHYQAPGTHQTSGNRRQKRREAGQKDSRPNQTSQIVYTYVEEERSKADR